MISIWKFDVNRTGPFVLAMPAGAQVLSVHTQRGEPKLWARVDTEAPLAPRHFVLCGTGHEAPIGGQYVGTVLVADDSLVFHLFELDAA